MSTAGDAVGARAPDVATRFGWGEGGSMPRAAKAQGVAATRVAAAAASVAAGTPVEERTV